MNIRQTPEPVAQPGPKALVSLVIAACLAIFSSAHAFTGTKPGALVTPAEGGLLTAARGPEAIDGGRHDATLPLQYAQQSDRNAQDSGEYEAEEDNCD